MTRILALLALLAAIALPAAASLDERVSAALAAHGVAGELSIRYAKPLPALRPEHMAAARVSIRAYDAVTGRFDALVETPAGAFVTLGRAAARIEVPVLARDVPPGTAIAASDVVFAQLGDRPQAGVALAAEDLIGRAARRHLRAGAAVRLSDLQAPIAVKKGDVVTMIFEAPGITLTAMGRATASGAAGDAIAVQNIQSLRTVEARIAAPGRVIVETGQARAATLAQAR